MNGLTPEKSVDRSSVKLCELANFIDAGTPFPCSTATTVVRAILRVSQRRIA